MSAEQETTQEEPPAADASPATEAPKLRRRPFGYSGRDVREALERQSAEHGARVAELAELRQDIAALWLAFAEHDRMIRRALGEEPAARGVAPGPPATPTQRAPAATTETGSSAAADEAAIGRQLSDLDDVLAAIELATQTLERTYAGETPPTSAEADEDAGAAEGDKPA